MDTIARIKEFIKQGLGFEPDAVARLTGDASDRVYYRVTGGGSYEGRDTAVIMHMPQPQADLPFLTVGRLLADIGSPVPAVLLEAPERGLLLLDDLGDITLQEHLCGSGIEEWRAMYARAVEIILDIQLRGTPDRTPDCPCFALAFDYEKLMFELNFFFENAVCIYKKAALLPGAEAALREDFDKICRILAAEPRVLCHRDYHSRNLMVRDGGLFVIDFQDARMGPAQYDLASLLCDSYVDLPPGLYDEMYGLYISEYERRTGRAVDRERFDYIYNIMVLQRNIKAAGSFAYLDCVKMKDRYLCRLCECFSHVRRALERLPEFRGLGEILSEIFEEMC